MLPVGQPLKTHLHLVDAGKQFPGKYRIGGA